MIFSRRRWSIGCQCQIVTFVPCTCSPLLFGGLLLYYCSSFFVRKVVCHFCVQGCVTWSRISKCHSSSKVSDPVPAGRSCCFPPSFNVMLRWYCTTQITQLLICFLSVCLLPSCKHCLHHCVCRLKGCPPLSGQTVSLGLSLIAGVIGQLGVSCQIVILVLCLPACSVSCPPVTVLLSER